MEFDLNYIKYKLKYETSIVVIFMVVYVVLFAFMTLGGGSDDVRVLLRYGANFRPLVLDGEVYRLITSAFLHSGFVHILVNIYSLYILGNFIENRYGTKKFIVIYIITALFGSLASMIFSNSVSIGASAAIFGMAGVILGNSKRSNIYSMDLGIDTKQIYMLVAINLVLGFSLTGIDNSAHIGGLISGIVVGYFLEPINSFHPSKIKPVVENVLFYLSTLILIYSFVSLAFSLIQQIQYIN